MSTFDRQVARSYGVFEQLPLVTAVELCPGLKILGAEHIRQLTAVVNEVNAVLRNYSVLLERTGLDECYLELTEHQQVVRDL